jgi:hypothetical protein
VTLKPIDASSKRTRSSTSTNALPRVADLGQTVGQREDEAKPPEKHVDSGLMERFTRLVSGSVDNGSGSGSRRARAASGEQAVVEDTTSGRRSQFLQHSVVGPERRTLKRIEALRKQGASSTQILTHLDNDRALVAHVAADARVALADRLASEPVTTSTATLVADALRNVGALSQARATTVDAKRAHAVVADAVAVATTGTLARSVRDVQLEKRDGGLQLLIRLKAQGRSERVMPIVQALMAAAGVAAVAVRCEEAAQFNSVAPEHRTPGW